MDGDILTGMQEGQFGGATLVTGALMPNAVGQQIDIPGSSLTPVGRHMMGDVTSGMNAAVAEQQSSLLSQLSGH